MAMNIFEERESNVRSYCRTFPVIFRKAKGSMLFDEDNREYIDFLAGAGSINFGHNNDYINQKVLEYISEDGLILGLDLHTTPKRRFLEEFTDKILRPRKLNYKIQFCGPTGTNSVEAALKIARKIKGRAGIFSFIGGYHGMSLGSLAVTGNHYHRKSAGVSLNNVTFIPYPFGGLESIDSISYIDAIINDPHSGIEKPAAIIVETIQAEGGVNVAPIEWLQRLKVLCEREDILFICDEIQTGCCRTGPYFSFERSKIIPDLVTLSKSISGYGAPMSLLLMKPELDLWEPGEHNGTFRGYQLAFVGAIAAIEFLIKNNIESSVKTKGEFIKQFLKTEIAPLHENIKFRGLGMIWGIDCSNIGGNEIARQIVQRCFKYGLVIELVGRHDSVLKLLPPLTIENNLLEKGCSIIKQAIKETIHANS